MAHFAITNIQTKQVKEVIVVDNLDLPPGQTPADQAGRELIINWGIMPPGHTAYQCSYSGSFRGYYPGEGWTYDPDIDEFVPPPVTPPGDMP